MGSIIFSDVLHARAKRVVLEKISMIGNDFALDDGVGVCGKGGQSVPVGVGQPSIKIDAITVGGAG